jgi:hypothetical protein
VTRAGAGEQGEDLPPRASAYKDAPNAATLDAIAAPCATSQLKLSGYSMRVNVLLCSSPIVDTTAPSGERFFASWRGRRRESNCNAQPTGLPLPTG